MLKLIKYFCQNHLLANIVFFGVMLMAVFTWKNIGKEEMPEFESNWVRINTIYPGASAEDVELFVTKPIEKELKGVVGIEEINSTSSNGSSSFSLVLDDYYPDKDEVMQEIKDAVFRADLPVEVREIPNIRQFKSSEKAILDVGLYIKGVKVLDQDSREKLQQYVLSFENQITALKEVSSITIDHYRKPELQVLIDPNKKSRLDLSLSEIVNQIRGNNIRLPVGSMQDSGESKVTVLNEYETVDAFSDLVLRGNYEGDGIKLGELAKVQKGFNRVASIFKINGHEGIFLNIRKSSSTDILTAQKKVAEFIEKFQKSRPDSPLGIVLMDDESYDVRNRLKIISTNGLAGFFLIVIVLLVFLNLKTGVWVAMGIPFSMSITLIIAHLADYTVNNMTLAAIIIVLGIVVDDAIIIAENIARKIEAGLKPIDAAVVGTHEVFKPIIASIITTCIAFIPLAYFEGFFGKLVAYIPLIVILMLTASLIESLLILPSHLANPSPLLGKTEVEEKAWFVKVENMYRRHLSWVLSHRNLSLGFFLLLILGAGTLFHKKMKYVMFPREESKEVIVKVKAPAQTRRFKMAKIIQPLEDFILTDKENVVGIRSSIALSRRGGVVKENEASILIELFPRDERTKPLAELLENWESKSFEGLTEIKFLRGRWGHGSGSAIEIQIQENDDKARAEMANEISEALKKHSAVKDSEVEAPIIKTEYLFKIKQKELVKFDVDPIRLTTSLRTFVEGTIAYSINKGEEEVDVRITVPDQAKSDITRLLDLKVENKQGQLIQVNKLTTLEEVKRPINIKRTDFKRTTMVYGDLADNAKKTPLEIADEFEANVFPKLSEKYPNSIISFKGEIEDSRESQGEFKNSVIMVVIFIYLILVLMFNSLIKPFIILTSVPFGLAGVIFILYLHSMTIYGFFAVIGALGMIGVVVNDAIVMIDRLEKTQGDIASVAATRLRPIIVTTLTTVVGVLPTAYGMAGYDSMLAEMMLVMGWGLLFSTLVTLILIPLIYSYSKSK